MIARAIVLLCVLGISSAAITPARTSPLTQLPMIYVEPSRGSIQDWFVFTGEGFEPGSPIWVIFFAPDNSIWDLVDSPVVATDEGTFRLPILPEMDLALVPGNPTTVQLGIWIVRFALSEETWYEQTFVVLP